ncbi:MULTISPECIES: hypothetical protein [Thalassobacillus]|nr:hypothetical protein [Thalassobacillus devorans]
MKKLLLVVGILFIATGAGYASQDIAGNDSDYPRLGSVEKV